MNKALLAEIEKSLFFMKQALLAQSDLAFSLPADNAVLARISLSDTFCSYRRR